MKGLRFYADFGSPSAKRRGGDAPNALAIFPAERRLEDGDLMYDGIAAVFYHPDSAVSGTGVSRGYLRTACKRISEEEAYRLHPALRAYLAPRPALADGGGS